VRRQKRLQKWRTKKDSCSETGYKNSMNDALWLSLLRQNSSAGCHQFVKPWNTSINTMTINSTIGCQSLRALFEPTKCPKSTGTEYFLSMRCSSTRLQAAVFYWVVFFGLKIALQIVEISMKGKNWICLAANSRPKKTSHQTFANSRLVKHHPIDRKYSVSIDLGPFVSSNKALKLWHHGCILIVLLFVIVLIPYFYTISIVLIRST